MAKQSAFSDSGLHTYLKEIEQYKLLSRQEEEEIGRRVCRGDGEARDRMIRCNLRLVVRIARQFTNKAVPLSDLVAEGNIGLMRAVERFNPEAGARFSTYATWWIRQTIRRAIQSCGTTVRVPAYMLELISRWKKASEELTSLLSRSPTNAEMAEKLELSPRRIAVIRRALRASHSSPETSPDMMWLFEDVLVDERSKAPDQDLLEQADRDMIERCLAVLDEREAELLRLRYGLDRAEPMTLQEIGRRIGVTRERVRQLEADALHKLARVIFRFEHGMPLDDDSAAPPPRKARAARKKEGNQ